MIGHRQKQQYTRLMEELEFEKLRDRIVERVNQKINLNTTTFNPVLEGGFTLVDGFITLPVQTRIGKEYNLGAPFIPVVGIMGNNSGRLYYFVLKALLPEEFEKIEKTDSKPSGVKKNVRRKRTIR
jgi:hypothetical protein